MGVEEQAFNFTATGIGSVPFLEVDRTCRDILRRLPRMPYWPQFIRKSPLEDMSIQYTEGLPSLSVDQGRRSVFISPETPREEALVSFYESYLAEEVERFAISETGACGLYRLLELLEKEEAVADSFIKGQSVGPLTFAAGVLGPDGKPVLHDPELLEAMTKGLAIKALWQVKRLSQCGRRPVLFFDEPYLSGFGSAFTPVSREQVIDCLSEVIAFLKKRSSALVGIHCCGNTDWAMIAEAKPDIINFDAFGYLDAFLLYPEALGRFLEQGGAIAWGVVPTSEFTGSESVDDLLERLKGGLDRVRQWGFSPEKIAACSLITPSCGMGTMAPEAAARVLDLLSELSERCQKGL
ncbi:MAG: hypothetical protein JRJ35_12325 [Deltaproteobacteria bacterium]|nr:hypothetical protein [Deltaproteobacteria bacterium]MBW1924248.1 hypothetical protein [Deltaproteobacteria bacterium]MBW1949221.1 hypothetical protein [Deltaproteobacteria bacterium]MBW2007196.1 hypothetical protein [Deltaproteobacteria bacterium]